MWSIGHVGYDTVSARSPNRDPEHAGAARFCRLSSCSAGDLPPELRPSRNWHGKRQSLSGTFWSVCGSSAPEVLLKAGLADGLAARLAGQVEATG